MNSTSTVRKTVFSEIQVLPLVFLLKIHILVIFAKYVKFILEHLEVFLFFPKNIGTLYRIVACACFSAIECLYPYVHLVHSLKRKQTHK